MGEQVYNVLPNIVPRCLVARAGITEANNCKHTFPSLCEDLAKTINLLRLCRDAREARSVRSARNGPLED